MLEYRRELDGLRALAVIAVLFYHANFMWWKTPLMRGGFLGVDVVHREQTRNPHAAGRRRDLVFKPIIRQNPP